MEVKVRRVGGARLSPKPIDAARVLVPEMRLLCLFLVFCLLCLVPSFALAKPIQVAVGKKSTWVNLETGDRRVRGRPLGRIEIDTALLRDKCIRAAEAFDGFVRLRPETRSDGWIVRVECMWRAQPTTESKTAQPIVAAPAAELQVPSF